MELLINIGNTHIQIAERTGEETLHLLEISPTEIVSETGTLPPLEKISVHWTARAVCVVPSAARILALKYGKAIRFLSYADFPQLDFSTVDVRTVGMDRIANGAAAFNLAKGRAATVIDFGTCINTVNIDQHGKFLGGAIMPGRQLLRKALSLYTAQLPLIPLGQKVPAPIGNNTEKAISGGIDLGIIGAVKELLAQTAATLGKDHLLLATGGDAPYFLQAIPDIPPAPGLLTLRGVIPSHV